MKKECSKCSEIKDYSEFSKKSRSPIGIRSECKTCQAILSRKYRSKNGKETLRAYNAKHKYNLTLEEYDSYLATPCDICNCKAIHLDHCHDSGKIRGGLCRSCNLLLGYAKDNTNTLRNAIKYLEDSCTQKNT